MLNLNKTPHRSCPICGNSRCDVLHQQRFVLPDGHPLASGYDVVCCERCGFVYADTEITQADYDKFYRDHSKYQDAKISTGGSESTWDTQRLGETARCIANYQPRRDARILDIGCANGGLLRHLAALGYTHLHGLDPSPVCVQHTRAIAGVEARVGSLANLSEIRGPYDLIILSHVLEHVQDLTGAAAAIARLTSDDGAVYIEVPDATRYADCVVAPFQDFNTEHINHFSPLALDNLMRRAGMQPSQHGTKTLLAPPPHPYPAYFAFYVKGPESAAETTEPIHDQNLKLQIQKYITISSHQMNELDARLRAAIPPDQPVIVWGVGQLAMKLLAQPVLASARIAAFVDGNSINHGLMIRGIIVNPPQAILALPYPIVITTTLHDAQIAATIRQMGMTNRIIRLT